MAVFETFFYIGSAISISVFVFAIFPTLLITKIIKKRGK